MCTCYCSQFGFHSLLKRQGPITILSGLCWFSGSNPCSRCLLSTHLLWQPQINSKSWKRSPTTRSFLLGHGWNVPFSLHQVEPRLLSWPLGSLHWGGLWASASPLLAPGHPHSPRTPVPQSPPWEPPRCCRCHLSSLLCQLGTSDNTIGSPNMPRSKIVPACLCRAYNF